MEIYLISCWCQRHKSSCIPAQYALLLCISFHQLKWIVFDMHYFYCYLQIKFSSTKWRVLDLPLLNIVSLYSSASLYLCRKPIGSVCNFLRHLSSISTDRKLAQSRSHPQLLHRDLLIFWRDITSSFRFPKTCKITSKIICRRPAVSQWNRLINTQNYRMQIWIPRAEYMQMSIWRKYM